MPKTQSEKTLSGIQDVFVYIAIFAAFYLFLKKLLKYARQTIDKVRPLPKMDEFSRRNGYSFDYTLVFRVFDEKFKDFNGNQKKFTMRNVVERLSNAGLDTKYFYSCQRDELYVKIRAEPDRLRAEAGRINYRLLLDPDKLRSKAMLGKKRQGVVVWKPILLVDEFGLSSYNPFQYIHAAYDASAFHEGLYKQYPAMEGQRHIFTGLDRIKLIVSIMEAHISLQPHGAGLNIGLLVAKKSVLAAFPLHNYDELNQLQTKWLNLLAPPWKQPVDEIKDYFGHRIGLYFLYLQHYVTLLTVPAVLGAVTFIVQKLYYDPENFLMPWFAGFMVLWSTVYIELWKRRQATTAMRWGSSGCEEEEQDRPLFVGARIKSPVTGKEITYFAPSKKARRIAKATSAIVTMICCVIAIVAGIYYFQFWINQPRHRDILVLGTLNLTSIIATLMNTVVIVVLNLVYQGVAIRLNEYENHRTDTQYEDFLIAKIFSFQLVNTFSGLTYVSFVKHYLGIRCTEENCTGDVAATLSTVFLSAMVTQALLKIFVTKLLQSLKERQETSGLPPGVAPSPLEEQYILNEYPIIIGTLTDYAGLVIQFGYTVLFVAAFPLAPTIAFVSGFIQIRVDGWKLCQAFRRPQPKIAEDIGMWQGMIEILSVIGVTYNFGLIFLTGHYLRDVSYEYRWILFIVVEHVAFFLKYALSVLIDDVPAEVQMQLDRQEFIVSKVIFNAEDEQQEEFEGGPGNNLDFAIHDSDPDWLTSEEEQSAAANQV